MIDAVTMRQGVLVSKLNGQTAACPKERSRDEYMHKATEELAREAGKQGSNRRPGLGFVLHLELMRCFLERSLPTAGKGWLQVRGTLPTTSTVPPKDPNHTTKILTPGLVYRL